MSEKFYDNHYRSIEADAQRQIRAEVFGEDLGQASWITADECRSFIDWLNLSRDDRLLEVGCGSGGIATFMARSSGCRAVGVDINEHAVVSARARAETAGLGDSVTFTTADAATSMGFSDGEFTALFCNDAINHLKARGAVLREWHRLLGPGGRLLYTDPIVVTGCLTNAEIAIRSSIGFFLFTPPGENERLLQEAGFEVERVEDRTANVDHVSGTWHRARAGRREALVREEGEGAFSKTQDFLEMVHTLASERRLSRFAYLARKAGSPS